MIWAGENTLFADMKCVAIIARYKGSHWTTRKGEAVKLIELERIHVKAEQAEAQAIHAKDTESRKDNAGGDTGDSL